MIAIRFLLPLLFTVPALASPQHAARNPAETALLEGRMAEASALLANAPQDGRTHLLQCRVAYAQNLIDPAVDQCQAAVAALPADSAAQLWLGRALGQKASKASALSAFGIARRVRDAFVAAVRLNSESREAAADLGEFYVAAPAIVGGGTGKATALAARVAGRFPALSHRLLALVAQKNGDLATAEAEFKAEVAAARAPESASADGLIDLANFYAGHKRPDDAVAAVRQALDADTTHGPVLVDAASILTSLNREPALAEQSLRKYLQSSAQSDAAPTFKARVMLGKLLAAHGDRPAAHDQFALAAALAPQYAPAQKALGAK